MKAVLLLCLILLGGLAGLASALNVAGKLAENAEWSSTSPGYSYEGGPCWTPINEFATASGGICTASGSACVLFPTDGDYVNTYSETCTFADTSTGGANMRSRFGSGSSYYIVAAGDIPVDSYWYPSGHQWWITSAAREEAGGGVARCKIELPAGETNVSDGGETISVEYFAEYFEQCISVIRAVFWGTYVIQDWDLGREQITSCRMEYEYASSATCDSTMKVEVMVRQCYTCYENESAKQWIDINFGILMCLATWGATMAWAAFGETVLYMVFIPCVGIWFAGIWAAVSIFLIIMSFMALATFVVLLPAWTWWMMVVIVTNWCTQFNMTCDEHT